MPKKNRPARGSSGQVRIIGGRWRSRQIRFPDRPELRPTGDRVRETLFNWLAADLPGSRCLDLFAGSGALGLEALSRGATLVHFVEQDAACCASLRDNLTQLGADPSPALCTDAASALQNWREPPVDILFLDPPWQLWPTLLPLLKSSAAISPDSLIYTEWDRARPPEPPPPWHLLKQKLAGQACFSLWRCAGH